MKKITYIAALFLVCLLSFFLANLEDVTDGIKVSIPQVIKKEEPIRILAFGDIMLGRHVRVLMEQNGLYYPFKKIFDDKDFVAEFDIITANLEGPITERFVTGGTSLTFGFQPDTARILKNLGFTILDLANNHMYDRGIYGYFETKKYLEDVGIAHFGHPKEAKLTPGYFKKIKGKKIAFLGFNDVYKTLDIKESEQIIKKVKKGVDYVFVFVHFGSEYKLEPNERQQDFARRFVDAGAEVVIGHHPHVIQSIEEYKGKMIFYSIGNFVFDQYFSKDVQEGLALDIEIKNDEFKFHVYPMKSVRSQPEFMTPEEAKPLLDRLQTGSFPQIVVK